MRRVTKDKLIGVGVGVGVAAIGINVLFIAAQNVNGAIASCGQNCILESLPTNLMTMAFIAGIVAAVIFWIPTPTIPRT